MKIKKRIIVAARVMVLALLIYAIACFGVYLFQDSIIFQPDALESDYVFKFAQPYDEHFVKTADEQLLNVLWFKAPEPSRGLILYFHGNADNLQRWGQYAEDFTALGFDVVMPEYRGYGKSTGKPGEKDFYADAQLIYQWAVKNIPHDRFVIYGRSLGSAVASHLATQVEADALILETPFDDLHGVVYPPIKPMLWFLPLRTTFPNKTFLPKVACRKVIIHGTDDWVVPLSSASNLKPFLGQDDLFVVIQEGSHKNLREFDAYHQVLQSVLLKVQHGRAWSTGIEN